ncbi:PREDICTED: LOW QUALITY PROTEIN: proteasome assembly chaperone 4 [Colobus angolensis palliatus]|nr:PREDICTED: LOW QUALITY PROTEIN: proteasome assembly chaperone 4 [Colobus angolensis palliatus]
MISERNLHQAPLLCTLVLEQNKPCSSPTRPLVTPTEYTGMHPRHAGLLGLLAFCLSFPLGSSSSGLREHCTAPLKAQELFRLSFLRDQKSTGLDRADYTGAFPRQTLGKGLADLPRTMRGAAVLLLVNGTLVGESCRPLEGPRPELSSAYVQGPRPELSSAYVQGLRPELSSALFPSGPNTIIRFFLWNRGLMTSELGQAFFFCVLGNGCCWPKCFVCACEGNFASPRVENGTRPSDSIPVSTSLLGDTSDTTSTGLAQRLGLGGKTGLACECGVEWGLSKGHEVEGSTPPTPQHISCGPARKTNKQVFVSYNLQNTDSNFALLVENRIKEEMEAFPEKF